MDIVKRARAYLASNAAESGADVLIGELADEIERIRETVALTGERREEVARILEVVARDGLPGPRDLDVALDAIESAFTCVPNDEGWHDSAEQERHAIASSIDEERAKALYKALKDLLVAVRYAEPPKNFGTADDPNHCFEARVPVEFVTRAEAAIAACE